MHDVSRLTPSTRPVARGTTTIAVDPSAPCSYRQFGVANLKRPPLRWRVVLPLASIPSPSSGNLGPFHMYGVLLAVGVLVATFVGERRWRNRGYPQGRHLRHRVLGRDRGRDRRAAVPRDHRLPAASRTTRSRRSQIWKGGLGIWGAVIGGALAVIVVTRRRHMDTLAVMDCMAPGIVLAQAIGRWGNWFNQELFGKPTTLPWGLEISLAHRPLGYERFTTFQPTFLYESLWCLAIFGVLLLLSSDRFPLRTARRSRCTSRSTRSAGSGSRTCGSTLRTTIGPLRVNAWMSLARVRLRRSGGSSGSGATLPASAGRGTAAPAVDVVA